MTTNHNHPSSPFIDEISTAANLALLGHNDTSADFKLTASATTTVVSSYYLAPDRLILWMPITATAAAAVTSMYVSSRDDASFTITHDNTADTDRKFSYIILG